MLQEDSERGGIVEGACVEGARLISILEGRRGEGQRP